MYRELSAQPPGQAVFFNLSIYQVDSVIQLLNNYVFPNFFLPAVLQRSHPGSADEADNITDEELEGN